METQAHEHRQEATEKTNGTSRLSALDSFRNSQFAKILIIGFLTLLLQLPISMISSTISERNTRNGQASEEVATKWGREQTIVGPFITVPFEKECVRYGNGLPMGGEKTVTVEYAHFLAEELTIDARTENLFRHRGIFEIPVYRVDLTLSGKFNRPDFSDLDIEPVRILWDRAMLTILITDPRAITRQAAITWNKEPLEFQPGARDFMGDSKKIQVLLKNRLVEAESFDFSCRIALQGSKGLFFAPMGRSTRASIASNWPDPSFQGDWLPVEQSIDKKGFQASWQISSLGRNFSQSWLDKPNSPIQATGDLFGVNFIQPVDTYCMTERSVKYQFLFLGLTFLTLWLFEVLSGLRLHPLQYLLVGGGMCLFYLLELSLAEHLGFLPAYILAASSVILLEGCYCLAILKSFKRSATVATFIALLYGYLYTLLIKQDYALLAGSIGLFTLLAVTMFLTRKIDWHSLRT